MSLDCIVTSWCQSLLLQYHSVLQSIIPVNPALQKTIPVLPCTAGCHFCTTKSTVLQTTSPILNTSSYSKHYPTIQSPTLSPTCPTKFYPVAPVHQLIILKKVVLGGDSTCGIASSIISRSGPGSSIFSGCRNCISSSSGPSRN